MSDSAALEIPIESEVDIVLARRAVREAAQAIGFSPTDTTRIVTAASELSRNIFRFAGRGSVYMRPVENNERGGIELVFVDQGPGIDDLDKAMEEGFSTGGGYGMGLPGCKRLMDEMMIDTASGTGTTITVRKWMRV